MHLKKPHIRTSSFSPLRGRKSSSKMGKKRVLRSVSADRDRAYFNILGSDGLVGTGHLLQEIELTRATSSITNLEIEDVVCRKQNTNLVFGALQQFLSEEEKNHRRAWNRIKFTDTIHVFAEHSDEQSSSRAMFQLVEYETKQQELWDLIGSQCYDLPLTFEVKIILDEGTSIDAVLKLLRVLPNSSVERVDFGGGLFGCKEASIPAKLASLFLKVKPLDTTTEEPYCTMEMIMFHLFYTPPHLQSKTQPDVLPQCINKLTALKTGVMPRRLHIQNICITTADKGKHPHNKHGHPAEPEDGTLDPHQSTTRPVFPKQHERTRRMDRIRKSKSKDDPLGGTSHHSKSKAPRRRRIKRQNSLPETDPDKAFARKNSTEINLEKWAARLEKKTRATSSRNSSRSRHERREEAIRSEPNHEEEAGVEDDCTRQQRTHNNRDDPLGSKTSHDRSSSKMRPRRHGYLKRQNSLPETKPDLKFARRNTAELELDQPGRMPSTVVGAAA